MDSPSPPDEFSRTSVGWLVQRLASRFEQAMEIELRPMELSLREFALLMRTIGRDGLTQSDLGAAFAMPAWKVSRNLDRLQEAGLIERRADPRSRRTHRIHATAQARDLLPRLQGIASRVNGRILEPLDPGQRAVLVALLAQLVPTQDDD